MLLWGRVPVALEETGPRWDFVGCACCPCLPLSQRGRHCGVAGSTCLSSVLVSVFEKSQSSRTTEHLAGNISLCSPLPLSLLTLLSLLPPFLFAGSGNIAALGECWCFVSGDLAGSCPACFCSDQSNCTTPLQVSFLRRHCPEGALL